MAEVADYSFPKCKGREAGGTYSTKRIHGGGEKKINPSLVLTSYKFLVGEVLETSNTSLIQLSGDPDQQSLHLYLPTAAYTHLLNVSWNSTSCVFVSKLLLLLFQTP